MGRISTLPEHLGKKNEKDDYIDFEMFADLLQNVYENPSETSQMDRGKIRSVPVFNLTELLKGLKHMKKQPRYVWYRCGTISTWWHYISRKMLNMYNGIITFDRIEFGSLFEPLGEQGVLDGYIKLLSI